MNNGAILIWNPIEEEENSKTFLQLSTNNRVTSMDFSPDGRFLASADESGEIIIWSREVKEFEFEYFWRDGLFNYRLFLSTTSFAKTLVLLRDSRDSGIRFL